MGLTHTSFYWASRLLRQMGHVQSILPIKGHVHGVEVATPSLVTWAMKKWASGLSMIQVGDFTRSFRLSDEYKVWLKQDLGVKVKATKDRVRSLVY
ncbi:hypothetical protein, partial [Geminicoccus harenae]|uniref:hypothetical protein n=1 Tax=Geminicoccus harenae TaxID=2498453 RepID=UPI001C94EED2